METKYLTQNGVFQIITRLPRFKRYIQKVTPSTLDLVWRHTIPWKIECDAQRDLGYENFGFKLKFFDKADNDFWNLASKVLLTQIFIQACFSGLFFTKTVWASIMCSIFTRKLFLIVALTSIIILWRVPKVIDENIVKIKSIPV